MNTLRQTSQRLTQPGSLVLWFVLIGVFYAYLDQPLAQSLHQLALGQHFPIFEYLTQLGRASIYLAILPMMLLFFRYIKPYKTLEWKICFVWFALVYSTGISYLLKITLGRARPELLFEQHLFGFYGFHLNKLYYSFPSGHVTLAMSLMLCLIGLLPAYRLLWLAFAVVVMFTRVLLCYHYVSDVLATSLLVLIEYRIGFQIIDRKYPINWAKLGLK